MDKLMKSLKISGGLGSANELPDEDGECDGGLRIGKTGLCEVAKGGRRRSKKSKKSAKKSKKGGRKSRRFGSKKSG